MRQYSRTAGHCGTSLQLGSQRCSLAAKRVPVLQHHSTRVLLRNRCWSPPKRRFLAAAAAACTDGEPGRTTATPAAATAAQAQETQGLQLAGAIAADVAVTSSPSAAAAAAAAEHGQSDTFESPKREDGSNAILAGLTIANTTGQQQQLQQGMPDEGMASDTSIASTSPAASQSHDDPPHAETPQEVAATAAAAAARPSSEKQQQQQQQQEHRQRAIELLLQLLLLCEQQFTCRPQTKKRRIREIAQLKVMGIDMALTVAAAVLLPAAATAAAADPAVLMTTANKSPDLQLWLKHRNFTTFIHTASKLGSYISIMMAHVPGQQLSSIEAAAVQQLGLLGKEGGAMFADVSSSALVQVLGSCPRAKIKAMPHQSISATKPQEIAREQTLKTAVELMETLCAYSNAADQRLLTDGSLKKLRKYIAEMNNEVKQHLQPLRRQLLMRATALVKSEQRKPEAAPLLGGVQGNSSSSGRGSKGNSGDGSSTIGSSAAHPEHATALAAEQQPLAYAELLSLLHVAPAAGAVTSIDDLAELLPAGSSVFHDMLLSSKNGSIGSSSSHAELSAVQSWLLPQLLSEDKPPLLVAAAAAAHQVPEAVAAALMAAAAELALAAAAVESADTTVAAAEEAEAAGSGPTADAAAAEELSGMDMAYSSELDTSSSSSVQGGWYAPSAAAAAVPAKLPWEDSSDDEQQDPAEAAAAGLGSSTGDELAANEYEESGTADEAQDLQQQQQQQQLLGDLDQWADEEDEEQDESDSGAEVAAARGSSSGDGAAADPAAAQDAAAEPHMLLLYPDQAAAAAAAKQHSAMLAETDVTATQLPGDLVQQLTAASQTLDKHTSDRRSIEDQTTKANTQLDRLQKQHDQLISVRDQLAFEDFWLPRLQWEWQQLQQRCADLATPVRLVAMQQQAVESVDGGWDSEPGAMQMLLNAMKIYLERRQEAAGVAAAAAGLEFPSWASVVQQAANNHEPDLLSQYPSIFVREILVQVQHEHSKYWKQVAQWQRQQQQQGQDAAGPASLANPYITELIGGSDDESLLQQLQQDWEELHQLHAAVTDLEPPLLSMQQQLMDKLDSTPTASGLVRLIRALRRYIAYTQEWAAAAAGEQAVPKTLDSESAGPVSWPDLLQQATNEQTGRLSLSMVENRLDLLMDQVRDECDQEELQQQRQQQLQQQRQQQRQQQWQQWQQQWRQQHLQQQRQWQQQRQQQRQQQGQQHLQQQQEKVEWPGAELPGASAYNATPAAAAAAVTSDVVDAVSDGDVPTAVTSDVVDAISDGDVPNALINHYYGASAIDRNLKELDQQRQEQQQQLDQLQQQQANADVAVKQTAAAVDEILDQLADVLWGTDVLFAAADDLAAVMRCQSRSIDSTQSTVLHLGWVRWCVLLPDQHAAAAAAAAGSAGDAPNVSVMPGDQTKAAAAAGLAADAPKAAILTVDQAAVAPAGLAADAPHVAVVQGDQAAAAAGLAANAPAAAVMREDQAAAAAAAEAEATGKDQETAPTAEPDHAIVDAATAEADTEPAAEGPGSGSGSGSSSSSSGLFWPKVISLSRYLPKPDRPQRKSMLSWWDSTDMTGVARLVVVTQDPSPELFVKLRSVAAVMGQEREMVRLAFTAPNTAAAAGAAAAEAAAESEVPVTPAEHPTANLEVTARGSSSSDGSSNGSNAVQCFLLPPVWPSKHQLQNLIQDLATYLKKVPGAQSFRTDIARQIWACVELYRLLDLRAAEHKPLLQQQLQQLQRWVQQQQQQQEQELVVVCQELASNEKSRARKQYDRVADDIVDLLQKAVAAAYPPLYMSVYDYRPRERMWRQSVVLSHDSSQKPSYRSDVDPNTPDNLKFSLSDSARTLLKAELPALQQQQQHLQAAAAAKGFQIMPLGTGSSSSSSSSSSTGPEWQQRQAKAHNRRVGMGRLAYRALRDHLKALKRSTEGDPVFETLQRQRSELPAAAARDDCLELLQQHQVLVITGETGCGKSTQVPQFILEEATDAGQIAHTNIVVSQPRRLITTALSSRVAAERGEAVGDVVGYSIHADRKTSNMTRLTFCTTGILIRRLMVDPDLSNVSHVIIDEVHERGLEVDFLMTAVRQLAAKRPDMKLILMSATVNAEGLMKYFEGSVCGSVGSYNIPGYIYDVDEFYLEDLIEAKLRATLAKQAAESVTKKAEPLVNQATDTAARLSSSNTSTSSSRQVLELSFNSVQTAAAAAAAAARLAEMPMSARLVIGHRKSAEALNVYQERELLGYQVDAADLADYSPVTVTELKLWAQAVTGKRIKNDQHAATVVAAIQFIVDHEPDPGAVLVFLPGWQSIIDVYKGLSENEALFNRLLLFPLHSMLSMTEQQEVFEPAPDGLRKVILATNLAESSITFDDVVAVIDSCRTNVASFDAVNNMPRLGPQWASQASLLQRRGRAGRVRRGMAVHLVPRKMAEQHLEPYDTPEIQRVPLADTCLLVKSLGLKDIAAFLAETPTAPDARAVKVAISELQKLWALDHEQELTPLGKLLALLPGDVKVTRMVIFAALLGVLDPVLTIAAAETSSQDLMRLPNQAMVDQVFAEANSDANKTSSVPWMDLARKMIEEQKRKIAPGVESDHEVMLKIFEEYESIMRTPSLSRYGRAPDWVIRQKLREALLNDRALASVRKERLAYTQLLYRAGFLSFAANTEPDSRLPWLQQGYQPDQLFDYEVDQLLGIDQQATQQQQPTAMDWFLGEYTDAAAGADSLLTLEELSGSSSSANNSPFSSQWTDEGYGNSSGSSSMGSTAVRRAGGASVLPSSDISRYKLQQLIKQYSWNADQPQLLHAVLAAGLYPNFAHVEPSNRLREAARTRVVDKKVAEHLLGYGAIQVMDPLNGGVAVHPGSIMSKTIPRHRWIVFSSKRLSTDQDKTYLLSNTAVSDLTALLFDTDMQHDYVPQAAVSSDNIKESHEADSADSDLDPGAQPPEKLQLSNVVLFQGYAKYEVPSNDLAALLQLRSHMQLLLQLKVAGLSMEVFEASQSFSSLLLQVLIDSDSCGDEVLTWAHKERQQLLQQRKQQAEEKAAAEPASAAAANTSSAS